MTVAIGARVGGIFHFFWAVRDISRMFKLEFLVPILCTTYVFKTVRNLPILFKDVHNRFNFSLVTSLTLYNFFSVRMCRDFLESICASNLQPNFVSFFDTTNNNNNNRLQDILHAYAKKIINIRRKARTMVFFFFKG